MKIKNKKIIFTYEIYIRLNYTNQEKILNINKIEFVQSVSRITIGMVSKLLIKIVYSDFFSFNFAKALNIQNEIERD